MSEVDILSISETWLNESYPVWQIYRFNTFRKDRKTDTHGGGTLLLIRDNIIVEPNTLQIDVSQLFEATAVLVSVRNTKWLIVLFYVSPSGNIPF